MALLEVLILAFSAITLFFIKNRLSRKLIQLPPGPPADPLIGHLRLIPSVGQDVFFYEMGKIYGDVVHLKVLGKSLIILNSLQASIDLLDKRGNNYSDRPEFPIFQLFGMTDTLAFLNYGKEFRIQRRMVQQYFSKDKAPYHRLIQTREARTLSQNLISTPEDWLDLLLRFSTAVIIDIAYGHHIVSTDDPHVKIADDFTRVVTELGPPGGTPVDLFPVLKHFPSWFPGTYYAAVARKSAVDKFRRLREYPFEQVTEQMAKGTAKPSFLSSQLEALHQDDKNDLATIKRLQDAAAIVYLAAAETTSSTLSFFFLAMVLYPDCQIKAREEIDAVVGSDRLPEFHDRESLPYLECLLQETLRWNQAVPSGVPHRTLEDDVYKGMFIPKGSTVIAHTRGINLDESIYKDPFNFEPTRFLPAPMGRGEPYTTAQFGFGRRICPGRHLAEDSLWIAIATAIATISISKAVGIDGKEIIPEVATFTCGLASHLIPFPCRLEPRSNMSLTLLRQSTEIE